MITPEQRDEWAVQARVTVAMSPHSRLIEDSRRTLALLAENTELRGALEAQRQASREWEAEWQKTASREQRLRDGITALHSPWVEDERWCGCCAPPYYEIDDCPTRALLNPLPIAPTERNET